LSSFWVDLLLYFRYSSQMLYTCVYIKVFCLLSVWNIFILSLFTVRRPSCHQKCEHTTWPPSDQLFVDIYSSSSLSLSLSLSQWYRVNTINTLIPRYLLVFTSGSIGNLNVVFIIEQSTLIAGARVQWSIQVYTGSVCVCVCVCVHA